MNTTIINTSKNSERKRWKT